MNELVTGRLLLSDWCMEDFEPLAAFLADGEANRHRGAGKALARDEAWEYLTDLAGQWGLRGYGQFAVEELASGDLVGWCGLWHPADLAEPELAWTIFPRFQGKGYATEAAERVLAWAAHDLSLPPLFSFVHPDNQPSRRLAERLGATLEGDTTFRGRPRLIYRHRDLSSSKTTHSNTDNIRRLHTCQS